MNFGEVLSKAWKIIWKNKVLWIFGILASCGRSSGGSGGRGNFNLPSNGNLNLPKGENPFSNSQIPDIDKLGQNFEKLFTNGNEPQWGFIIGLICLIFFIAIIFAFLSTIGRIGLIRGTVMADNGQEPLTFGQVWTSSLPYFWKVFFLNLLFGLVIMLAMLIVLIPLIIFAFGTMGIGLLCIIPLLCLFIPLTMILNVILEQANVAMVVEDLGIWASVVRGWNVCRENIGPVAVVALVIIFGGGIAGFIIALPLLLVLVPLLVVVFSQDQSVMTTGLATSGVLLCCLMPVVIGLQGILQSYIGSIWTLTFVRLTAPKPVESEFPPSVTVLN